MAAQGELFGAPEPAPSGPSRPDSGAAIPLAERLRPRVLEDLVGQEKLVGPGSMLRDLIERDHIPSMILWGPPGSGKTSLARIIAGTTGRRFVSFSAVLSGVAKVREVVAEARAHRDAGDAGTILFVDEIHRFNRSQQDAFLPHVEDGTIVLIGATTENPSFEVNAALLSRCQVLTLEPHTHESLAAMLRRALADPGRWGLPRQVRLDDSAIEALVSGSHGDARSLLNRFEAVLVHEAGSEREVAVDGDRVSELVRSRALRYDKSGEDHFNLMSALHKSLRGGDPQASLYWLARMMESGEDPHWIARRLVRFASEDVGLADPRALEQTLAAWDSYRRLGSPEGDLALAQAAVYLATSPKSNSVYAAWNAVREDLRAGIVPEVPLYLRNASTSLMKKLGYSDGYVYPHDVDDAVADQDYLPPTMKGKTYYRPSPFGHEKEITRRIEYWQGVLSARKGKHDERD